MSGICLDLSPVGMSTEFDGSPDALESGAQTLRSTATTLDAAAANIRRLTENGNELESQAFSALAERSSEVHGTMGKVALRYRLMATATQKFAEVLRTEQQTAARLVGEAAEARNAYTHASQQHSQARLLARDPEPSSQQRALVLSQQANVAANRANAGLESAKQQLRAAAQRVNDANKSASEEIRSAMEVSGLDDTLWDKICYVGAKIGEAAAAAAKWIWDNIDTICLVLDIVALVLAFIPGIGTAAGALIKAVTILARVAKGVSLIKTAVEGVEKAQQGDGWGAVGSFAKIGLTLAAGPIAKKVGSASKVGTDQIAKKMFSIDSSGKIQQTAVGRGIHNLAERFAGPTFPAGTPLPSNFVSQHIGRTTALIQGTFTGAIEKGTKVLVKDVLPAVVEAITPKPPRPYCFTTSGQSGVTIGGRV